MTVWCHYCCGDLIYTYRSGMLVIIINLIKGVHPLVIYLHLINQWNEALLNYSLPHHEHTPDLFVMILIIMTVGGLGRVAPIKYLTRCQSAGAQVEGRYHETLTILNMKGYSDCKKV